MVINENVVTCAGQLSRESIVPPEASEPVAGAAGAGDALYIATGEYAQVPQFGRVERLGTDGINCCVVVAMRGDHHETGQSEVLLAHLDSQQYAPSGHPSLHSFGGKTDVELMADDDIRSEHRAQTMQATRAFSRTHNNIETIVATNFVENPLNISQCLYVKAAMSPPPKVHYLDESDVKGGRVALDVQTFDFYKLNPQSGETVARVLSLPDINDVRAVQKSQHASVEDSGASFWQSLISWF